MLRGWEERCTVVCIHTNANCRTRDCCSLQRAAPWAWASWEHALAAMVSAAPPLDEAGTVLEEKRAEAARRALAHVSRRLRQQSSEAAAAAGGAADAANVRRGQRGVRRSRAALVRRVRAYRRRCIAKVPPRGP